MEINPFYLTNNIPAEFFCDRKSESRRLIKSISNQEHVVLSAQRRIGKTGLINHCFAQKEIKDNYYTIAIDILHTSSLKEFVQELGNATFKCIAGRSQRLTKSFASIIRSLSACFGYDPVNACPTFSIRLGDIAEPSYTLDEIFEYLEKADRPCIVAIDEFQQILRYEHNNIEEILRGKIQKLSNTHLIFAGSERRLMSEMFNSEKRPFYQSATSIELSPIERDVYFDFARAQFEARGKSISHEGFDSIYNEFEGITSYVHRILHDTYAATPEGGTCTTEDMESAASAYLEECSSRLKELFGNISEQQKELFYAICDEGTARSITSSAFVKKHNLKSASAVQSAAKGLIAAGLVTKTGNTYTISDPLMKVWIETVMK